MCHRPHHQREGVSQPLPQQILTQVPGIVWTTDLDLRITSLYGDALASISAETVDAVGRPLSEFVPNAEKEPRIAAAHQRALGGEAAMLEIDWDGRAFHASIGPLRNGEGGIAGCVAIACDVGVSAQWYRALVEQQTDPIARFTPDTVLTYVNEAYCRYLGTVREELIGTSFLPWVAEADRPVTQARLESLSRETPIVSNEERVVSPSGEVRWLQWINRALFDSAGRIVEIQSAGRDITERKRLEEALRESEQRFRLAFDEAPVGMAICIDDGIIARVNRAMCRITDYAHEELLGRHVREFQYPEDREVSQPLVQQLFAGEIASFTVERRYVAKGGRVFWAQATTVAARSSDGKLAFALGVVEDITQRRQAEETLRHQHDELRAIHDGMIEGILITDIETKKFLGANKPLCRMLGYSEEELLGASIKDIHPPEEVPNDLERFQAAAEGRVSINEDRPVLRKDGSVFYADITGHRIVYNGRPCLLALFRDVTERKQAQKALERERQTLRHMLRASDHERQLIAYEIHDGLAQELAAAVMQFQVYGHLKDHQPDNAKTAFEAGVQMLRQAHFEARRLISGVRPPILDESGIVAALAHLVHDYRSPAGPQIEFHSQVSFDRLPKILENAIYRIAQEALTNATRHSRSEKVRVSLVEDRGRVGLEIQDWGIGFEPASVEKDRFGLEGMRERTRLLGGQIAITSQPGTGTLVQVTLPLMEPDAPWPR